MNYEKDVFLLTQRQLAQYWGVTADFTDYRDETIERVRRCFQLRSGKYYSIDKYPYLSVLNTVHYSIFLYFLSNTIFKAGGDPELCAMVFYLNKILHSVDWYYEVDLPAIFCAEHPLGSVMGKAVYSDHFFFYQGCTVGGSNKKYPHIGRGVVMYSNSSILGNCTIGNHVILGAGTLVKNEDIPSNSLVFGQSPHLSIVFKDEAYILSKLSHFWISMPAGQTDAAQ